MFSVVRVRVTTAGSDGSAVGSGYSARPLCGAVRALHVDFAATAPGTTDIDVVFESDDSRPETVVYSKDNSATDVWVYPTVEQTDTAGAGVSAYQNVVGAGRLKVSLAGCNA